MFDTILPALGLSPVYVEDVSADVFCISYGQQTGLSERGARNLSIAHVPSAWDIFSQGRDADAVTLVNGVLTVIPDCVTESRSACEIPFDLVANAFYFLSSWSERVHAVRAHERQLYANSVYARLGVPQNIVDSYVTLLRQKLLQIGGFSQEDLKPEWPDRRDYAVVLSHDVDFVPSGTRDTIVQGAKSVMRHLWREGNAPDAFRSAKGLLSALVSGRDPYGCVPEIIEAEKDLGVRSSFQVAVARRHPADVNYSVEAPSIRDYLGVIRREGFDLCLHGSYRSTEDPQWYLDEVALLAETLGRPKGSRQHFLSFNYDALFLAQEKAGIEYDMSMGYPDRIGPRSGFSFPYFPYCLAEDRPYDVLQISLCLMDVTLRSYMGLRGEAAWEAIAAELASVRACGGGISVVWHPIVFGGARDPGDAELYWRLAREVLSSNGHCDRWPDG